MQKNWLYNVLFAQRKISNWIKTENNKKSIFSFANIILIAFNQESHPPYRAMVMLNEVHLWWKVGCLLGCWIIVGLGFCSILAGYYLFPDDPNFRWLWLCSGWYFNSLSPLHKPALVASILPSQECHIGSSCCPSWHSWWSFKDNKIYILFWCRHRYLGVVIGDKGLSLISYHFHLRMPKAGLFPSVKCLRRKSEELFRLSQKYPSLHVFCQILKWLP